MTVLLPVVFKSYGVIRYHRTPHTPLAWTMSRGYELTDYLPSNYFMCTMLFYLDGDLRERDLCWSGSSAVKLLWGFMIVIPLVVWQKYHCLYFIFHMNIVYVGLCKQIQYNINTILVPFITHPCRSIHFELLFTVFNTWLHPNRPESISHVHSVVSMVIDQVNNVCDSPALQSWRAEPRISKAYHTIRTAFTAHPC